MKIVPEFRISKPILLLFITFFYFTSSFSQGFEGYYQNPALYNNTIVFAAEGDLWTVPLNGGLAQRLTSHQSEENFPAISPDGKTIAFSASYEGPTEVYTMPIEGGLPKRWTYEAEASITNSWTPDGKLIYNTNAYSKVPDAQIIAIDLVTNKKTRIPLAQASEASYDTSGKTIYFVRPAFHRNVTKRYQGGTARQIWKYTEGTTEAVKLTKDYVGESHHPMWFSGRIYFISDRDGMMNIWSMNEKGEDLKQHTTHKDFDVRSASISNGNIVYQMGADLWKYNLSTNQSEKINIKLVTDLDQMREKWDDNPSKYITSVHADPDGKNIVITARGRVFVAPVKSGRFVSFTDKTAVRFRDAVFSHDGSKVYTLSDESGEFEFVSMPSNGQGAQKAITNNGKILRFGGKPSSDGKWIAYSDLDNDMYLLNIASGVSKKISSNQEGIGGFSWSPDNKWLAFEQSASNTMIQIKIYNVDTNASFDLTTDRANSSDPSWSPDGKFIYFLSDRSFTSLVESPWGTRQPEPYFDASEKVYYVALKKGTRSPFRENDELTPDTKKEDSPTKTDKKKDKKKDTKDEKKDEKKVQVVVSIDQEGIQQRITEVPVKPGNYSGLAVNKKALYLMSEATGIDAKSELSFVKIDNEDVSLKTMVSDVDGFELTDNGEKILLKKDKSYYMLEAGTSKITDLSLVTGVFV